MKIRPMIHFRSRAARLAACLLTALWLAAASTPLRAQTAAPPAPALPVLATSPIVLEADGRLTLTVPATLPERVRAGVYEHGRPALLDDTRVKVATLAEQRQIALQLSAEAGVYDVRLLSDDRARNALSQAAVVVVPGVDREPGWWLFNGTPFAAGDSRPSTAMTESPVTAAPLTAAPLFLTGLGRDFGRKPQPQTGSVFLPGGRLAVWKTFDLPPLREIAAPGYDFAALRATLAAQLQTARERGEGGFIGFALPARAPQDAELAAAPAAVQALRRTLDSLAPGAALILEVETAQGARAGQTARTIDAAAAWCDAVLLRSAAPNFDLWPLKVARRVAEEQPHYDLPIFVRAPLNSADGSTAAPRLLEAFMSGATGVLDAGAATAAWGRVVQRNLPLFVGSVTLEDIGVLPSTPDSATLRLVQRLRGANRFPLLARVNNRTAQRGAAESFAVALGERLERRTLGELLDSARSGARLYIEGAPLQDENGRPLDNRIVALLGGEARPVNVRREMMTLDDPWFFGTASGRRLAVEQRVTVVPRTLAEDEAKGKKGEAPPTISVAARLADGSPAVLVNPVGDGEVIWMPHRILDTSPLAPDETPIVTGADETASATALFYAAVAGRIQPALVQLENVEPAPAPEEKTAAGTQAAPAAGAVRAALRSSAEGVLLLGLFNTGGAPAAVRATVRGAAGIAFDLAAESALPLSVRGFTSQTRVTLAPRDWALIAFAENREKLDKARNAPRLKARWK